MKNLIVLFILIALELFIFPMYNFRDTNKILSRTTMHFLGILNSVFSTRQTLKNCTKILPVIIIMLDYLFGKFLISNFYDANCRYFESKHSLTIITITIIPFLLANKEDIEEYEQNAQIKSFHVTFSTIIKVNQLFYFYKHFHLKHGNIVEYNFNLDLFINFIVDFLVNSFSYIVNNLLCFLLFPSKSRISYLKNIFNRFILMILANIAFYSIYSFQMARSWFESVNSLFPNPHSLILYNFLPDDLDQRFRLFLYIFNWLLS
jgi:hypothetical protein